MRKPLQSDSDDLKKAAAYLLASSIVAPEKGTPRWEWFQSVGDEELGSIDAFVSFVEKQSPDFEKRIDHLKSVLIKSLEQRFYEAFDEAEETAPGVPADSPAPEHYIETTFGEMTVLHPDFLSEPIEELIPKWEKISRESREALIEAKAKRPFMEVPYFTGAERKRFIDFGLKEAQEDQLKGWADLMWISGESDRLFHRIFPRKIEIWMRADITELLENGGRRGTFKIERDEVNFTLDINNGDSLGTLTIDEFKKLIPTANPSLVMSVLDVEDVEGKSKDELITALQETTPLKEIFAEGDAVEKINVLMGEQPLGISEREVFFVVAHEQAESSILRDVIGSPDRRWFADGLANYIAMRMTEERFGEGAGKAIIDSKFPIPEEHREEILKQLKLLTWKSVENESADEKNPNGLSNARYFYATKVIEKAVGDRGDAFVKSWIKEIQKTRWNRTRGQTVVDAYDKLTGGDLKTIVETIAED